MLQGAELQEILGKEELILLNRKAAAKFQTRVVEEITDKLQEPLLEKDTMSTKSAVFCWFLLLTGAISSDSAFILLKDEDKEFELQQDIRTLSGA
ncbi:MAG: hypothetical protein H0Z35_07050 [Thermoanaerobacteraceae bacterium]|nr:hypothetical protein [Thermoanaerobacteraceae bacterium]